MAVFPEEVVACFASDCANLVSANAADHADFAERIKLL